MSKPLRTALSLLLALASGSGCGDIRSRFSSTYTDLNACQDPPAAATAPDGSDTPRRCQGPGAYEIVESYSAAGTHRSVELAARGFAVDLVPRTAKCPFASYGDKVKWRLVDGVPFAAISRVRCYGSEPDGHGNYDVPQNLLGEYLIVRGLVRQTIDEDIDVARTADANRHAQELADKRHAIPSDGPPRAPMQ
jgi:hypothetical protein